MATTRLVDSSGKKLWLAAIKPPMYSVAIMPILLGSVIAFSETKQFNQLIFITFLISAILILAWENLSNDVFDSETGIDINKPHSVVNLTQNKSLVFWLGNLCLGLGILGILTITGWQHDPTVLEIILLCCALGYVYQGHLFASAIKDSVRFSVFLLSALAIAAAYYSQAQSFSLTSLAASIIIGITTSLILFCSHFHQAEDDLAAGKKSPIVRLGTARGSVILTGSTISVYILTILFVLLKIYPIATLLIFGSLPSALKLIDHVREYHDRPEKISNCKFLAVNFHFVSGVLFALGFMATVWFSVK